MKGQPVLHLRSDHLWFGIAVERVQEVIASPVVTAGAAGSARDGGRADQSAGQIVTVIELRRRFGFEERPVCCWTMVVVEQAALAMDEIGAEASENAFGCARQFAAGLGACAQGLQIPGRLLAG